MSKTSPLHRVIDAGQWDAERLLGRLIIVVHAAFLDAGFVPATAAAKDPEQGRISKQQGATASTLSLRYAVPQLRQDTGAAALRMFAHGRHVVFYVRGDRRLGTYWVCVDALAAARYLSYGLDDTARALRRDAQAAALWGALADGLCRRVLAAMCRENGVALEPTFMSLPGDAKAAILARIS
ncbi:hypothetical protein CFC21_091658 [Triticum aestivum]|uniref:Uncharacterized protein n=2 Tax=Triticum aestivum TaxID=4565 RepID=A0A9R1LGR4_WHEAT|nr:uncharacterized protein LOC123141161 [Triticum aestivum]KAF7088564.1 hypothetical protein CFC21_091658 [Triticum aestivum]